MVMKYQKGIPIDSERRVMIGSFFLAYPFAPFICRFRTGLLTKLKKSSYNIEDYAQYTRSKVKVMVKS